MLIKFKLEKFVDVNHTFGIKYKILYQHEVLTNILLNNPFIIDEYGVHYITISSIDSPEISTKYGKLNVFIRGKKKELDNNENITLFNSEANRDFIYNMIISGFNALSKKYSYLIGDETILS